MNENRFWTVNGQVISIYMTDWPERQRHKHNLGSNQLPTIATKVLFGCITFSHTQKKKHFAEK